MLRSLPLLILSPTRFIIDQWKRCQTSPTTRGQVLWRWNSFWFYIEVVECAALVAITSQFDELPTRAIWLSVLACYFAFSRAVEISYAFVRDISDRLADMNPASDLASNRRIVMAFRSYIGLASQFAVLFFFLPGLSALRFWGWSLPSDKAMSGDLKTFFDALYFSVITITTTGYGDIKPMMWPTRTLAMWEVLSGLLLIAVAFAIYLSPPSRRKE
ncbi:MAG TPA: potassium channel family protein [Rhizomicrobium sp.]